MCIEMVVNARTFLIAALLSAPFALARENQPPTADSSARVTSPIPKKSLTEWRQLIATRDEYYEKCASVCQSRIDEELNNCPGGREIRRPDDKSPPPPRCKGEAVERYERCMQSCPQPAVEWQG